MRTPDLHAFILATLLLLASSPAEAQVREMALQERPGGLFEAISFNNSYHASPVQAGEYYFGYANEGAVNAHIWVSLDGQELYARDACCTGLSLLDVPHDGVLKVEATGNGKFIVVDSSAMRLEAPRVEMASGSPDLHAWAFSLGSAQTALCVDAPDGADVQVLDESLRPLDGAKEVTNWTTSIDTEHRYAFLTMESKGTAPPTAFAAKTPGCAVRPSGAEENQAAGPALLGVLSALGAVVALRRR